ncbi:MAG: amino acid permease [Bacteroidales bacterium]|nr:amino acid permease [Bacteroidales bacterium]
MSLFRKKSVELILSHAANEERGSASMKRSLSVRDLTAMGIAAIVGAGIFSTIGNAASSGGPAVSLLFVFTALACGFSAMCYAEFASRIPISGGAYTYAYASFGELIAWIIGWDLIMEYAVGNIAVAISWSGYFTGFMGGMGIHIPEFLSIDYLSAARGFNEVVQNGLIPANLDYHLYKAYTAWMTAPSIGGIRIIADVPAFTIVVLITALVYIGIYETKVAGNIMVLIKLMILMLVIGVGAFYINPENWSPFAPNGLAGVMKGTAGVFFAYIGFDAISTTAEECRNPRRDLPRSMIYSLLITTVLYVLISLVLTGMVSYTELGVNDPLAYAFEKLHLTRLSGIIGISAIIAMAGVLLVFQVGQPRIWMSMSRDGLLPPRFAKLHPRFKTPAFSTILTGILVAIPSLFLNLTEVTDLTSIGTLFAFALVSGGIIILNPYGKVQEDSRAFRIPYFNSRFFLIPLLLGGVLAYIALSDLSGPGFSIREINHTNLPMIIFSLSAIVISYFAVLKKWSLIPVMGLILNLYLMSELGVINWLRFGIWLLIGLSLYFVYGYRHSRLNNK